MHLKQFNGCVTELLKKIKAIGLNNDFSFFKRMLEIQLCMSTF